MPGKRSWHESPWHLCMKCFRKTHLSEMTWQLGLLLCHRGCYDYGNLPLVGMREQYQARVLMSGDTQGELRPDRKLTEPTSSGIIEEIIL